MKLSEVAAIVTGGASGLGEAVVRAIISGGGKAAILDLADDNGSRLAAKLGGSAIYCKTDVSSESDVTAGIERAAGQFGRINVAVNAAGIVNPGRIIGKKGPIELKQFELLLKVNLIGTFNVIRLAAMKMTGNDPNVEKERGVIVNTASVAAFDGQIGQAGYAASKSGIVGMTLPLARELAAYGIRVMTIAPGIFDTPMMASFTDEVRASLGQSIPFPSRMGRPDEFASLVLQVIENTMLNGETIRLDGAIRMAPK
jgi:3-hydroxyacyl-CoA dehydrogenase / 3-hydroxy-2-methylbutyryl-CoA dehydrogenase